LGRRHIFQEVQTRQRASADLHQRPGLVQAAEVHRREAERVDERGDKPVCLLVVSGEEGDESSLRVPGLLRRDAPEQGDERLDQPSARHQRRVALAAGLLAQIGSDHRRALFHWLVASITILPVQSRTTATASATSFQFTASTTMSAPAAAATVPADARSPSRSTSGSAMPNRADC